MVSIINNIYKIDSPHHCKLNGFTLALHRSNDYDLSQFTFEKTVANKRPTLLALVSQLVSNLINQQ
jgi:hypothetical protein